MVTQRPRHRDPRQHRISAGLAMLDAEQQNPHRSLPMVAVMLFRRQLGDVVSGIAKRDELAAIGQLDGVEERARPAWPSMSA